MYEITKWNDDDYDSFESESEIIGYVETEEEAKRICSNYNKYNSLSTLNPDYYAYTTCKFPRVTFEPIPYIQVNISLSFEEGKFEIELNIVHTTKLDDVSKIKKKEASFSVVNEVMSFYIIPKANETPEELKERCINEAVKAINGYKVWKEFCASYDVYLGEEKIEKKG